MTPLTILKPTGKPTRTPKLVGELLVRKAFHADAIDGDVGGMLAHEAQTVEERANFQAKDGPTGSGCAGRSRDVDGEIGDVDIAIPQR